MTLTVRADTKSFAAVATPPAHVEAVGRYLGDLIARGATKPEWCFVVERDGAASGRAALWTLPGQSQPMALILLDLPWADTQAGDALLTELLGAARTLGTAELEYVIDAPPQPPQWQHEPELRAALLARHGFVQRRQTRRFGLDDKSRFRAAPDGRLDFRTLGEVGEAAFRAAMVRVTQGTLDQRTRDDLARLGPEGGADATLALLKSLDHRPDWWALAYEAETLVGLVAPARAPTFGTIGYIGVVPQQRGRGRIDTLLAWGTAKLLTEGALPIRADTDLANTPMANAFLRAGYHELGSRREFALRI